MSVEKKRHGRWSNGPKPTQVVGYVDLGVREGTPFGLPALAPSVPTQHDPRQLSTSAQESE